MLLGAHVGISGGFHNAVFRGEEIGCDVIQIFTRNQMQWNAKPITQEQAELFKEAFTKSTVKMAIAHGSYLINLATPEEKSAERAVNAFELEVKRCAALGIPLYVFHPGSHSGTDEASGIDREVKNLKRILDETEDSGVNLALEGMAGQGDTICHTFDSIHEVLRKVDNPRMGVCLDTCHLFAAGYDISSASGVKKVLAEFNEKIGMKLLFAVHLNDSRGALGSHLDRHENIGKGKIGKECFKTLMHMRSLSRIPMALETPNGEKMYSRELKLLRSL